MIRINLLGDDTVVDHSRYIYVGAYLASIIALIVTCVTLNWWTGSSIEELASKKEGLDSDLKRLQVVTAEVKDIEKKQKDLENRIVRIAALKRSKQGPARILDALNLALPERAWLVEAREKSGEMKLGGVAIDGETISNFTRELEKSDNFPKVQLDVAKQVVRQGVKVQEFIIKTNVSYGGRVPIADTPAQKAKPGDNSGAK